MRLCVWLLLVYLLVYVLMHVLCSALSFCLFNITLFISCTMDQHTPKLYCGTFVLLHPATKSVHSTIQATRHFTNKYTDGQMDEWTSVELESGRHCSSVIFVMYIFLGIDFYFL